MKKILLPILIPILGFAPIAVGAATKDLKWIINTLLISNILRPVSVLLVGLAVLIFIYGVITLVISNGGEKREDGKKFMFWGIIGIFVIVSVWGLVALVQDTFKLDTTPREIKIEFNP